MRAEEIRVVGVGNGGCRMVDRIASRLPHGPAFAASNTEVQAGAGGLAAARVQIGAEHTDGLGAGGHVSLGRLAAEEDIELVRALFSDAGLLLLVVGLGGGTGTGAAPVVLESARAMGVTTLCVATVPFGFEGAQRRLQADEAIPELRDSCDALLLLPNDRLFEADESAPLGDAFRVADRVVGDTMRALWELLTVPGYINLDVSDLKRVVHMAGGVCTATYGVAEGDDRAEAAVTAALEHTLVEEGRLVRNARVVLVSICGGRDLRLKEVGTIMEHVRAAVRPDSHVFVGTALDEEREGAVSVALVLSDTYLEERDLRGPVESSGASDSEAAREGRQRPEQTSLALDAPPGRGRFKNVEPTILEGEDVDIPTFVRRGIPIEK